MGEIRVVSSYRLFVVLAVILSVTACTGSPARHPGSQAAGANPAAGDAAKAVESPPASAFAAVDWPVYARKFFGCASPSGESWDQFLPDVRYADVTGDGIPDALVIGACPSSTSGNPVEVVIFSGASQPSNLQEIADLPQESNEYFVSMNVTIKGTVISLDGSSYDSPQTPLCCPDAQLTMVYQWHSGRFTQVSRDLRKLANG
jgi:hypothetical protein